MDKDIVKELTETPPETGFPPEKTVDPAITGDLHFAFQPLINIHTGTIYGYEALLRGTEDAGFEGPHDFFDRAFASGTLYAVDLKLRRMAIEAFLGIRPSDRCTLFYNLDNRFLLHPDYQTGNTHRILKDYSLQPSNLCFEISERHELPFHTRTRDLLNIYKTQNYKIALDDFGSGYAGLQLLYNAEPDLIKIDRFFIGGITSDSRKKLFVSNVVGMAHILGMMVIAEGVETENEFRTCRDIGCDFAQGYYIEKPAAVPLYSPETTTLPFNSRRNRQNSDKELFTARIKLIPPVQVDENVSEAFRILKSDNAINVLPVVNGKQEPLGIISEKDLLPYLYTPYGYDLLSKKTKETGLASLISPCPVSEVNSNAETVLQMFSLNENTPGVLLTDNGEYLGFLEASSLLKILGEKKMAAARDQNPLTGMPGNTSINEHLSQVLAGQYGKRLLVYFDLDNFKPFNDHYGFRRGDRAILLFADMIRKALFPAGAFLGHIGGDDFFASLDIEGLTDRDCEDIIGEVISKFSYDVTVLYDHNDLAMGGITALDREGNRRVFPTLTVSAAMLYLRHMDSRATMDSIVGITAELKKGAKASEYRMCSAALIPEYRQDQ